ncbi:MAG: hypothetical protein HG439_004505 [candidate division SR1 bacterium]|nr:hypothetical protein [candidate division SR1 bacterium]
MEKIFVDGYLSCQADEFLQILEQNDFDLRDTSTTSSRIKMNIVVAGEVYLPTNLDKAMYLEDIIFLDDLVIEDTIFQQDITLRRCSFKKQLTIRETSFSKNFSFIACKVADQCRFSDLRITNDLTLIRSSFELLVEYSKINVGGKYSSSDCCLDGLKVGRIPLVES